MAVTDLTDRTTTSGHPHPHDHDHNHDHEHPQGIPAAPRTRLVELEQDVLAKNDRSAARNREWFRDNGILALNVMSSPGSGKTTLLERTIRDLSPELTLSVVEGDQETLLDAERIRATGCRVVQINTGSGCHLDADMLARGLQALAPPPGSIVLIENVGNLVCPALFDLGEAGKVVIMSVTEGADKPLKYPHMFRAADVLVLNKLDLLPYVDFDVERCIGYARQLNPDLQVLTVSATKGDELDRWYVWLRDRVATGTPTDRG
ncbi:MAG: hydrogenase nickel incorporation protein HypB [Geodermatophilaceae bacterium]